MTYQTKGSVDGPGCSSRLRYSCPELLGLGILVVGEVGDAIRIYLGEIPGRSCLHFLHWGHKGANGLGDAEP